MKLSVPGLLLVLLGGLLIYSAREERDPRNILFEALGIKRRVADPQPTTGAGKAIGDAVGDAIPDAIPDPGVPVPRTNVPVVSV